MPPTPLAAPIDGLARPVEPVAEVTLVAVLRPSHCCTCAEELERGELAWRDPVRHALTCAPCHDAPAVGEGQDVEVEHALVALAPEPGPEGELVLLLNDRCQPASGQAVDHLAITPNGVWVVTHVPVSGPLTLSVKGGGSDRHLLVNGQDGSSLVEALVDQLAPVRAVLDGAGAAEVDVRGAICLVGGQVRVLQRPVRVQDHLVTWPSALRPCLLSAGPFDAEDRIALHELFERALPATS